MLLSLCLFPQLYKGNQNADLPGTLSRLQHSTWCIPGIKYKLDPFPSRWFLLLKIHFTEVQSRCHFVWRCCDDSTPPSKGRCRGGMGKVRQSPLLPAGLGGRLACRNMSVWCDLTPVQGILRPQCPPCLLSLWFCLDHCS